MFRHTQREPRTRTFLTFLPSVLAAVAAVAAASGCATHQPAESAATAAAPTTAPAGRAVDLALRDGTLVDAQGRALYVNDQERGGVLRCVGPCLDTWIPVAAPRSGAPAGPVPGLGVLHRSDTGLDQLTYLRQPLYEFRDGDAPSGFGGNGVRDTFHGTELTWTVVRITSPGNPTASLDPVR